MSNSATEQPAKPLVSVAGADTDQAIADLAGMYAGKQWYSAHIDDDYWYRYAGVGDGAMSIRRSQMHGYLRGDVAVENEVVVQWIDSGSATIDTDRHPVALRHGLPTLFPVEQRFEMEYRDWDQRLVHLSRDLVLDVASERYLVDGTLSFQRSTTPSTAAIEQWQRSVAGAVRAFRNDGLESLAWHEAQRDVARSLLDLYRFQAPTLPDGYGERRNRRVRAAVEFIHAHAGEPLTVADIARAADISVRGLQESFQRTLDRTPMNYLREVRLRRSYEDLERTAPGEASVADIASRWGFTHMGRFSSEYLQRFGEYPKNTLRRH